MIKIKQKYRTRKEEELWPWLTERGLRFIEVGAGIVMALFMFGSFSYSYMTYTNTVIADMHVKSGMGEFQFGLVTGSLNGDFKKTNDETIFDFTFDGSDECDPTNGDGWMKIKEDGTAEGEIRFHMGDSSKFWAKKSK